MSSPCAWNCSSKLTAGSTKPVIAAKGMASCAGAWLKQRPTSKPSSRTFRSQKRFWMTIVISSGKLLGEVPGDVDAGRAGLEGDVEMMLAGQPPGRLDLAQHPADDRAQRLLHDLVIGNQTVGRLFAHGKRVVALWIKRSRRSIQEVEETPCRSTPPCPMTTSNIFARILRGEIPSKRVYEDEYRVRLPRHQPAGAGPHPRHPQGAPTSRGTIFPSAPRTRRSPASSAPSARSPATRGWSRRATACSPMSARQAARKCRTSTSTFSAAAGSGRCWRADRRRLEACPCAI